MKTLMTKQWLLLITAAACILLVTLPWQHTSLACWDTYEEDCSTSCDNDDEEEVSDLWQGQGGVTCSCVGGTIFSGCDEDNIGECFKVYECTQLDCEGTCIHSATFRKYRCLTAY